MVRNEIVITLTFHYKLVSTWDDGSCYIVYAWPRQGFPFSYKQSMQVEEDSYNF